MRITKNSPITALLGCGKKRAELFLSLGISTVGELIRHFPRGYQNRGDVKEICDEEVGSTGSFVLTVASMPYTARLSGGRTLTKCKAVDGTKTCTLIFFNRKYLSDVLYTGATYRFWGKLTRSRSGFELAPSVIEPIDGTLELPSFVPIYPLTKGITQNYIKNLILSALDCIEIDEKDEVLPFSIRQKLGVPSEIIALRLIHQPKSEEEILKGRNRFITEELFIFACSVTLSKKGRTLFSAKQFDFEKCKLYEFTDKLPFTLTKAQSRVISEIRKDLVGKYPMARLVSGDVGSGKTVCAMAAAYMAIKNGYQCAVMAPTEILAMQHYRDFSTLFSKLGIKCEFLTGSMTVSQKRKALEGLKNGDLKLVVGTHALISDKVEFENLGLVVTDEQHRFGVMQRATLQSKGTTPHVLVMSATPIPRTLALILLGDLDISVVDELPPGRQVVDTLVVNEMHRQRLYGFIDKQVELGRQVYIVCPSVEAKEEEEEAGEMYNFFEPVYEKMPKLKSAVDYAKTLQNSVFPNRIVAFLHGKMKGKEKDAIMTAFANGEIDILVSTTVIEVGVNVPNATLMIVENAERFGLSQLHQLRGRVGRGNEKSYCVLVSDSNSENAQKRLEVMKNVSSGYEIAKYDLQMRGPGDFISSSGGARQHGAFSFKLAGLCSDALLLDKAFRTAEEILSEEKILENEEYFALADAISKSLNFNLNTKN